MDTQIAFPAMVKAYRLVNGLTMEQLAEKIGKTKSTISKWESGTRSPKIQEIEELAIFFNIEPTVMMFGDSTPKEAPDSLTQAITDKVVQLTTPRKKNVLEVATTQLEEQEKEQVEVQETSIEYSSDKIVSMEDYRETVSLPVDGALEAGTGVIQENNLGIDVTFYVDEIPDEDEYDGIAMVVGRSMEPVLYHGDYLFIDSQAKLEISDIGAFQINGKNVVKKYRTNKLGTPYLESINHDYDDIYPTEDDDFRVLGVVIDVVGQGKE